MSCGTLNICIKYSFDFLDAALRQLVGQVRLFQTLFTSTLVERASGYSSLTSANSLHRLWQHSWLNWFEYEENPFIGDWRPRFIKQDSKFYTLHPLLHHFLDN